MRNILHTVIALTTVAFALGLPACTTDEGASVYVIAPLREAEEPPKPTEGQEPEPGKLEVPENVIAHIFMDVEGSGWRPMNFEEARDGILRDTTGGKNDELTATASFTQDGEGSLTLGSLDGGKRRHYLVICDQDKTVYAWRELKPAGDAGTIYLSVYFRPWKTRVTENSSYTEEGWTMINPLKKPETPEPETPDPEEPEPENPEGPEEGGDAESAEAGE